MDSERGNLLMLGINVSGQERNEIALNFALHNKMRVHSESDLNGGANFIINGICISTLSPEEWKIWASKVGLNANR